MSASPRRLATATATIMTSSSGGARGQALSVLAAVAVAIALRLLTWSQVFTPAGVRFFPDTDPHYHVLRAERILEHYPAVPWTDAGLSHPHAAAIPWPPLFDHVIATASLLASGGERPSRQRVEQVAAFVPVAIGALTVPLVALLASLLLGGRAAAGAAWLLALFPVHVGYSMLGRPDQHVAEVFVLCWLLAAFAWSWRGGRAASWGGPAVLAAGIAVAFWTWQGSALYLLVLAAFTAAWHLVAERSDPTLLRAHRALAAGAGIGGLLLGATTAWWGPPGALSSMTLSGVTGLQVVLTLATASFAGLLLAMARWWRSPGLGARLGQIGLAASATAAVALAAVPGLRDGIGHGLEALTAGNPWYRQIAEFRPLVGLGPGPLPQGILAVAADFGVAPLLMALSAPGLRRRWRESQGERAAVLLLSLLGGLFVCLAVARARFILYLAVPAVLLSMSFATAARTPLSRRLTFAAFALLALPIAGQASLHRPVTRSFLDEELIAALSWLRGEAPPGPADDGVLASWIWGHAIQYYAARPAVVGPFGTEAGADAMAEEAAFFRAQDPDDAMAIVKRRRVGFLLLDDPIYAAYYAQAFAPDAPAAVSVTYRLSTGEELRPTDAFEKLVPARLYFGDGLALGDRPALDGYRLLYECPPRAPVPWISRGPFRIFGVVPGAQLEVTGAAPHSTVTVSIDVRTNQGRAFRWTTSTPADADGSASLRVPYATGRNGAVVAGPAAVSDSRAAIEVSVPPSAVARGDRLRVDLEVQPAGSSGDRRGHGAAASGAAGGTTRSSRPPPSGRGAPPRGSSPSRTATPASPPDSSSSWELPPLDR